MHKLFISVVALAMISGTHQAGAEPSTPTALSVVEPQAAPVAAAAAVAATAAVTEAPSSPVAATPAVPAKPAPPAITLTAAINLQTQRMTVSYGGKVQHTYAISSGARGFETPAGSFKPQWTAKLWHSRTYDNAPMPHAVFFNGGIAVHATQSVGRLGSPASHGCIRLSPANAAQFYALVGRHGNTHTRIAVTGRPNFNDEVALRHQRNQMARQQVAQTSARSNGFQQYNGQSYYSNQPKPTRVVYRSASYAAPSAFSTTRMYRY
jgi:lipoprotein-anchoring transpeptidase ErfK/SrfK